MQHCTIMCNTESSNFFFQLFCMEFFFFFDRPQKKFVSSQVVHFQIKISTFSTHSIATITEKYCRKKCQKVRSLAWENGQRKCMWEFLLEKFFYFFVFFLRKRLHKKISVHTAHKNTKKIPHSSSLCTSYFLQVAPNNSYKCLRYQCTNKCKKHTQTHSLARLFPLGAEGVANIPTSNGKKSWATEKCAFLLFFARAQRASHAFFFQNNSLDHLPMIQASAQTQLSPSKTVHKQRYCSLTLCLFPLFWWFLMCKTQSLAKCIFAHTAPITLKPPRGTGLSVPQVPRAVLSHQKHKTKKFQTSENSVSNRPKNSLIPP